MKKYVIKMLKAPWPEGAGVGDVIELPEPLPAWALGKVEDASENATATVEYVAPVVAPDPIDLANAQIRQLQAENASLRAQMAEAGIEVKPVEAVEPAEASTEGDGETKSTKRGSKS